MKYVLMFYLFNGPSSVYFQQEFPSARTCQDAKTVMMSDVPAGMIARGYCFPL